MKKLALILTFATFGFSVCAELDSASQEALSKTQELMRSKEARQKYVDDNPKAKAADGKIDELTSDPEQKNSIYDTSADIFNKIVQDTNGDPEKQKELLNKAAADPEAFYNSLPPEQRDHIRDIAGKIQKQSPMGHPN